MIRSYCPLTPTTPVWMAVSGPSSSVPSTRPAAPRSPMTWSVLSPDGTLTLEAGLDADGRLGYRVLRNGNEVVARSQLGVLRTDTSFDAGLVLVTASDDVVLRDRYTLVHGKQLEHDVAAGTRTLELVNRDGARLELDLRA